MLYLDYSRKHGEWVPNALGGKENLEAISFLKTLNEVVYAKFPDVQTYAEESTAWPMVSRPTSMGGLGFGLKWNMGWMHDTLQYFQKEPIFRKHHHHQLTFSLWYAFNENFVLPISHDEVVHGKGSLYGKMSGDEWQKFANLRLFLGYMFAHPGKKLLFMGCDYGQWGEWNHDGSLDWEVLKFGNHAGVQHWIRDLNKVYRSEPALHSIDFSPGGFEWIEVDDHRNSTLSFLRKSTGGETVLVVCNFTPMPRADYRVGVPLGGMWKELLNSDALPYGGSGHGNLGGVRAEPKSSHGRSHSLGLMLPPLGVVFLKPEGD
jgi:1,4-alpha-glucan branching enzyme